MLMIICLVTHIALVTNIFNALHTQPIQHGWKYATATERWYKEVKWSTQQITRRYARNTMEKCNKSKSQKYFKSEEENPQWKDRVSISFGLFGCVSIAGLVQGELGHGRTGHGHQHAHLQHHPHVVLHACHSDNFKDNELLLRWQHEHSLSFSLSTTWSRPPQGDFLLGFLQMLQCSPIHTPQVPCVVQISRRSFLELLLPHKVGLFSQRWPRFEN